MRADAIPMDEYVTYSTRVLSGKLPDMGFTPNDFAQHIAGLVEKRSKESFILAPFIDAVRDALAQKNWFHPPIIAAKRETIEVSKMSAIASDHIRFSRFALPKAKACFAFDRNIRAPGRARLAR
jgi:hypothetical protein